MKTELALLLVYESPVMTLKQIANLMGLSERTMENHIYAGTCPVPMFKLGRKWHGHIADIAKYIDAQRDAAIKGLKEPNL